MPWLQSARSSSWGGRIFLFFRGRSRVVHKELIKPSIQVFFLNHAARVLTEGWASRGVAAPRFVSALCVCVFSRLSPQHKVGQVLSLLINAHCQRSHARTGVSQSVLSLCGTVLRLLLKSNLNAYWFSVSGCTAELPVEWLPAPLGF